MTSPKAAPLRPRAVAIVQARMGSSRLPGKSLERAEGKTLLEHVVQRLRQATQLDDVWIATTTAPADDAIERAAEAAGWGVVRGSEADVLDRYRVAAHATRAEIVVRVTADCPLVDPAEIDRVVGAFRAEWPEVDYAANFAPDLRRIPFGGAVEVFSRAALGRAHAAGQRAHHREHVTPFLYEQAGRFRTRAWHPDEDLGGYRFTVDTPEDLAVVRAIFAALGDHPANTSMRAVARFLDEHPEIRGLNTEVRQKHFREAAPAAPSAVVTSVEDAGLMLLRADAGPSIGAGHVVRCLAIARAWQSSGGRAAFLTLPSDAGAPLAAALLQAQDFGIALCELSPSCARGSGDDARWTAAQAAARGAHALVVDGYAFDAGYLAGVCSPAYVTAFLDDHGADDLPGVVRVRPRPGAPGEGEQGVLAGASYVLLRPEFLSAARPERDFSRRPLRLLVTFGASDPMGLSARAVAAALELPASELEITLLVGDLSGAPPVAGSRVRVLANLRDMPALLGEVDVALGAAGGTAWELAFMGIPALLTSVAANQRPVAEAVAALGAGRDLGPAHALEPHALAGALRDLTSSPPAVLQVMSRAGMRAIDGRGAERVAAALASQYKECP